MTTYTVGQTVRAIVEITEDDFNGQSRWTHAYPDDEGTVIHVDKEGNPTVRFEPTGTATVVFDSEIEPV